MHALRYKPSDNYYIIPLDKYVKRKRKSIILYFVRNDCIVFYSVQCELWTIWWTVVSGKHKTSGFIQSERSIRSQVGCVVCGFAPGC
jgi:hypothetical protein